MYYLTDEELNYHLSVISLFSDSPYLPSLDYSSPSSSQDSYEEGARSETTPEQVKSGSTELIIKHYNPNGLPVVLNEDLEPMHPMEHTCLVCSQRFSSRYNHTRHMETHSANRAKFPCHLCPKYFTVKFSLNRHIDNLH
ncbi:hypothetical protein CLU79DRAFT_718788 [Phycomyces nitens]|nr:hypothetical protein CLU79DRAFT_718788 [Phycomyces nitens]